jgi:hypothetical protein
MAEDCRKHIVAAKDTKSMKPERFEVTINYFLSSLLMLSDDVKSLNLIKQK